MKPLQHKKHTLAKRGLSLLCVLALCLGLLPATALAATVENITYLDKNGTQQTAASATQVTNSDTEWTDGWYVAQSNITIDGTVTISGNVHLILEDGCNLTVNGGILLTTGSNMYIYAQSTEKETMGSLTTNGTDAGIKEANYGTPTLTIAGGKITAIGSDTGISAGSLTITDGYVSVSGTGYHDTSISVMTATISGGFVDLYGDFIGTLSTGTDGHAVISSTGEINNIAADCKGLFLIQNEGKIYGDTFTLTQDLNIAASNIMVTVGEGQTLTLDNGVTLTIPQYATLTNNGTLNNKGTLNNNGTLNNTGTLKNNGTLNNTSALNNAGAIINNGTLTGEVGGSGTVTPKITTDSPLPEGTVGESYTATLQATGNNITWSSSDKPKWMTLSSSTGVISGTPTTADTYTFTVTATNASGSDSKAFILTVTQPVTSVTLDKNTLELYTGGSENLTATVAPDNATNKNVTWSSSDNTVATVDTNGKVTAVKEGTAAITATAADDSNISATCTVTVTDKTYTISADPTALNFGSAYTGYTQPAAQTVILTNTGNQPVTLTQPASTNSFEVGTLSKMQLAVGETATFTVQPKENLPRGSYSEQIVVSNTNDEKVIITATFTVKEPPYSGKYSYEVFTSVGDNGTISVDRYATEGDKVTIDVTPDEAYKLDDLTVTAHGKDVELTANGDGTYTFTMPSADVRITATFAEDPDWTPDEPEEPTTDVSDLFIDIAPDAWYKDAVQYAYDNGLMTGVSATEFDPEATTTRAMIVSILARLENVTTAQAAGFADVDDNDWYATAVNWAANVGVVNGYEDNTFRPNTAITREQLAAILMNYAAYKGEDVSNRADLTSYTDQPSTWAEEAMSWAVAEGLISGVTADTLQPQGAATRAQVAAILQRFLSE